MAVETTGLTALVAIVSLLAMGVIGDDESVLVLGTRWVHRNNRADILATIVNFRHVVFLQEASVLLLLHVLRVSLLSSFVKFRSCGRVLREELGAGEFNELVAFVLFRDHLI